MRCDVLAPVIFLACLCLHDCILDEESRIICRQWHFAVLEECFTDNFSKLSVFGTCTSKKYVLMISSLSCMSSLCDR